MAIAYLILTVALAAAFIVIVLALVCMVIYHRWRIYDNNVHLEKFINENLQMRGKMKNQEYWNLTNNETDK